MHRPGINPPELHLCCQGHLNDRCSGSYVCGGHDAASIGYLLRHCLHAESRQVHAPASSHWLGALYQFSNCLVLMLSLWLLELCE